MRALGSRSMPGLTKTGELVRLELPAQPAFVGVARSVVAAVASSIDGIDDDRLEDLRVAVSEACTNAVSTHSANDTEGRVIVRCARTDGRFQVVIEDSGRGLDPATLPDTDAGGWGLQLIEALVDAVTFTGASGGGTSVELVMELGSSASASASA